MCHVSDILNKHMLLGIAMELRVFEPAERDRMQGWQGLDDESLLNFEVDFDLGDLLRNGAHQENDKVSSTSTSSTSKKPTEYLARDPTSDFRKSCEFIDEMFTPTRGEGILGRDVIPPLTNPSQAVVPSAKLRRPLPLCSGNEGRGTCIERTVEHIQKKIKTGKDLAKSSNFTRDAGTYFDTLADMDWDVELDNTRTSQMPGVSDSTRFNLATSQTRDDTSFEQISAATLHIEEQATQPFFPQENNRVMNTKLSYAIPGPAGAIQMGLDSKRVDSYTESRPEEELKSDASETPDFRTGAWLKALQYFQISEHDPVQYSKRDSTISHIKSSPVLNRVPQLIAIIKTCTPNGCGDAFVTLKDPTGTISGTVHRKLLAETEFGRDIVPEAVILLCKVAVFRPSARAQYLNITVNNVIQVFRTERS